MNKSAAKKMKQRSAGKPDIELGKRIRLRRVEQKISQAELGDKLGVSFQQVQKYEKGVNRVGAGRLTKIAEVLGIEVGAFFGAKDGADAAAAKERGESSPLKLLTVSGAFRLLRAYGGIEDSNLRRAIVDLVEQISSQKRSPS